MSGTQDLATPRPWRFHGFPANWNVVAEDGTRVARLWLDGGDDDERGAAEATGQLIVRAVNSHDALVAALTRIAYAVEEGVDYDTRYGPDPRFFDKDDLIAYVFETASAALRLARGGTG